MARGIIQEIEFLVDQAAAAKLEADAQRVGEKVGKSMGSRLKSALSSQMAQFTLGMFGADMLGGFVRQVGAAVRQFALDMYSMATSAEETRSKFRTTFGAASGYVESFINKFGEMAGIAKVRAMDIASTMGAIAQGMGMSEEAAGKFSTQVLKTAGDVQSFFNIPIQQVLADMQSGFAGQVEPMRKYGVELSQEQVKLEAYRITGKKTGEELTRMERTQAALAIMSRQLGKANGDLERTQSSVTNRGRALGAMWENTKQSIADRLLPAFASMTDALYKNRDAIVWVAKELGTVLVVAVNAVLQLIGLLYNATMMTFTGMAEVVQRVIVIAYKLAEGFASAAAAWNALTGDKEAEEKWRKRADLMDANAIAAKALAKEYADLAVKYAKAALGNLTDPLAGASGPMTAGGGGNVKPTNAKPAAETAAEREAKQSKADSEQSKRIGVLTQGAKMERTRAESVIQLQKEEAKLAKELEDGNLSLERRIKLEGELKQVRETLRDASPEQLEIDALEKKAKAHRDEYEVLIELSRLRDALIAKQLEQNAAGAAVSEEEKQRTADQLERLNDIIGGMKGPEIFAKHTLEAMRKAKSVTEIFKGSIEEASAAMMTLGAGSAQAYLKELAKMAEGEYKVAVANVVKYTGVGLYKLATNDVKGAGLSFAAAGKAALEAVKWRAVMAVGNAAGGGDAGGGGGGGDSGGSGGGNTAGDAAADAKPSGPNITVYVDGVDPDNASHQAYILDTYENAKERVGENGRGTIRVRRRSTSDAG